MDNLPQTNGVKDEGLYHGPHLSGGVGHKKVSKLRWRVQETMQKNKKKDNRYCSSEERKFTQWIFIWPFLAHICMARVFMLDSALTSAR